MTRWYWLWTFLFCAVALPAEAQIGRGTLRFSIDADMLSVAFVEIEPEGRGEEEATYFGLGPNQRGGAGRSGGPTGLGLGFAYALSSKLLLGARFGLGFDVVSPDGGDDNNVRFLALSIMPGLTFVPVGNKAKLFLSASPLLQVDRTKWERGKSRALLGGFGLGVGVLIFPSRSLSVDLGFHFEGRFGGREWGRDELDNDEGEEDIKDLRALVRLGVSFWK